MLLGRDFITCESIVLDLANNGFSVNCTGDLCEFAPASLSVHNAHDLAAFLCTSALPAKILETVEKSPFEDAQKRQPMCTLEPFMAVFTEKPSCTPVLRHRIDIGNTQPWICNPRPLSVHKQALLDALQETLTLSLH